MSAADKPVVVSKGKSSMRLLIPKVNEPMQVVLPLKKGEVRLRVLLTMELASLDDLREKCDEAAQLRNICADYEGQLKELEKVNQDNIAIAEKNIDKLTKKFQSTADKYNELQEKYMGISVEYEKAQGQLMEQRELVQATARSAGDAAGSFKALNDELTAKIAQLSLENENLKLQLRKEVEDKEVMRLELDELYANKYEDGLHLNDKISALTAENTRLNAQGKQQLEVVRELQAEVERLKCANASKSISFSSSFVTNTSLTNTVVNNTYIETIMNNSKTTNTYITNIIQSVDAEAVKKEFLSQLRRCDALTKRNLRLMDRLQAACHPLTVAVRTRPPDSAESAGGINLIIENAGPAATDVNFYDKTVLDWSSKQVDMHWGYDANQEDVFTDLEPLIASLVPSLDNVLEGRGLGTEDAAVIAYGGKGSGKTFSLFGFGAHVGIAYRTLQRLFELLDFQSTALAVLAKDPDALANHGIQQGQMEYKLFLSLVEVSGDKTTDVIKRTCMGSLMEAVGALATALNKLHAQDLKMSSVLLEIAVEVSLDKSAVPVRKSLRLADVSAFDAAARDPNVTALETALLSLGEGQGAVASSKSPLVAWLSPALQPSSRVTVLFTLSPSDLTLATTKKTVDLAARLRGISRPLHGDGSEVSVEVKTVQLKMRTVANELKEQRARNVLVEETLVQTKHNAADLVNQFNERNKLILKHYAEEKSVSKQLQLDLELTHRHLKRVLEELKDQKKANERMMQILKVLEDERQGVLLAKTAAAAALTATTSPTK